MVKLLMIKTPGQTLMLGKKEAGESEEGREGEAIIQ
jgi:hypothetical protein